jgi:hypothetical protein
MNKEEIKDWLAKEYIRKYTIHDNLVVDIHENVYLGFGGLTSFPFQFGIVQGSFSCSNNKLTSLEHCPKVIKGEFECDDYLKKDIQYLRHYLAMQLQSL